MALTYVGWVLQTSCDVDTITPTTNQDGPPDEGCGNPLVAAFFYFFAITFAALGVAHVFARRKA
ncbi:MAG: hypothetical protein WKF94_04330 [Solirubrobacteraceae bacterium]